MKSFKITLILFISMFVLETCEPETQNPDMVTAEPIEQLQYGTDVCAFADQVIETVRYGGKITMVNGETFSFMSTECLAAFYLNTSDKSNIVSVKVVDFTHGKRLMDVDEMIYLRSKLRPSPNGMFLSAIEATDTKMITNIYDAYPGDLITWNEVLELVRNEWDLTVTAHRNL
jgi:nucleoid DNA-binding protein